MISTASNRFRRSVARLRVFSEPLKNKLARIAPRSSNDYATHIPILVGIAQHLKIRRVLELGCGMFSTSTFLNKEAFPDLIQLDSYETDRSWLEKTAELFDRDRRFRPRFVTGLMSSSLSETHLEQFDLIFVDDSASAAERVETIRQLVSRSLLRQFVVIHDFEIRDYRKAASNFEHRQAFRTFTPQTGVVWNGTTHAVSAFKNIERQIIHNSKKIPVDDVQGWRRAFRQT